MKYLSSQFGFLFAEGTGETLLPEGGTLLMLGDDDQRQQFAEAFEQAGR